MRQMKKLQHTCCQLQKTKQKTRSNIKQNQRITHSSCHKHKNKDDPNSGNDLIMKKKEKKTCINAWSTLTMHEVK